MTQASTENILTQAAAFTFLHVGDWLQAHPQDVNAQDAKGRTVLHYLAMAESAGQDVEDTASLALQAGADVHGADGAGETPFNAAAANAPLCGRLMTLQWLHDALDGQGTKGLNDVSGAHGSTLAQYMAKWLNDDELEPLLRIAVEAGLKPCVANNSGWTPLMAACAMGRDGAAEAFMWHYHYNDVFLSSTEEYKAVYGLHGVTYAAGLNAAELAFARLAQDKGASGALKNGLCRCIALCFSKA